MEVDRVGRMGEVGEEATPAWTREKMRRRRFSLEVEPEEVTEESVPGPEESGEKRDLDVMA